MTFIKEYSGVVALVILAIMLIAGFLGQNSKQLFGSTACSGITCLSGGLRLVSDTGGDFESDVATVLGSSLSVAGLSTLTGTTTEAAGLISTKASFCLELYATSTATKVKETFAATSTASAFGTGGVIPVVAYGTCN